MVLLGGLWLAASACVRKPQYDGCAVPAFFKASMATIAGDAEPFGWIHRNGRTPNFQFAIDGQETKTIPKRGENLAGFLHRAAISGKDDVFSSWLRAEQKNAAKRIVISPCPAAPRAR